jgi:hypothetical protein
MVSGFSFVFNTLYNSILSHILIHSRSIVVLIVIILQSVTVKESVALVWDVAILAVLHWHVDLLSILSLLHVERGVRVVEASILRRWKTLHWSHCLVLRVQNL